MKPTLRKEIKAALARIDADSHAARSRAACERLIALDEFRRAGVVLVYMNIQHEVATAAIALAAWRQGKTVLAPRLTGAVRHMVAVELRSLNDEDLSVGAFGVREPAGNARRPAGEIDFIVVPGIAFDESGHRLGRGGGYFDCFLADPSLRAFPCGLAFEEQIVPAVPRHDHDVPVKAIVTDRRTIRLSQHAESGREAKQ